MDFTSNPQFWAVVVLFATFLAYLMRSEYNRWHDKRSAVDKAAQRQLEREAEKLERSEMEKRAKADREEIAAKIKEENREVEERVKRELERNAKILKQELDLHYAREVLELEKNAFGVIKELDKNQQVVKMLDGKIVTLTKAAEHKDELKEAIQASTEKASAAYEVANTINEKLSEMSKAGLLTKEQEAGREGIDEIEEQKEAEEKVEEKEIA